MGSNQSILKRHGYTIEEEKENYAVATKGDDKFFIKKIKLTVSEEVLTVLKSRFLYFVSMVT